MIEVEPEAHPLFMRDEDDDRPHPRVDAIHLVRDGVWCPKSYLPEELRSLEQIGTLYGGGTYELIARSNQTGRVSDRRKYRIEGAPKPFVEHDPAPARAPALAPAMMPMGGGGDSLLVAVLGMMSESQKTTAQMMMASQQATLSLITGLIQDSKTNASSHVGAMAELAKADKERMADFFEKILAANKPSAGGSEDSFMRGMEFAAAMMGKDGEEDWTSKIEQWLPIAQQFLAGMRGAQAGDKVNPGGPAELPADTAGA